MSESNKTSSNSETNSKTVEKIPHKKGKGKTAKELMKKHISDKNDVISEEDFKNLEVDLDAVDETSHTPEIDEGRERPKDEDKDPKNITPWSVISE